MSNKQEKRQAMADRMVAREDLHQVAAALIKANLLTPEHVRAVKATHKLGRGRRDSLAAVRNAQHRSSALADQLRELLRSALLEVPERLTPVTLPETTSPRKKVSVDVIAIEDLPTPARTQMSLFEARPPLQPVAKPRKQLIEVLDGHPKRLAEFALRQKVVSHMKKGMSARAALDEEGAVTVNERSAQRWALRAKADEGCRDGRWTRQGTTRVLGPGVQDLIIRCWNARYSASAELIAENVKAELLKMRAIAEQSGRAFEYGAPSASTVRRYLRRLPEAIVRQRSLGRADFNHRDRMLGRTTATTFANELWEMDCQELKVRIRVRLGAEWDESRVWLLVILDVYSRAVMGWILSTTPPDAWTTCKALYVAILPKQDVRLPMQGMPVAVKPDRGGEFMNDEVKRMLNGLGIALQPAPPNYPNAKGKVESFFSSLQERLANLPGYADDEAGVTNRQEVLLDGKYTFTQLSEWFRNDVVAYNNRAHSGIDMTPQEAWLATAPRQQADEEKVTLLLLHAAEPRVVQHCSVQLTVEGEGGVYQHETLGSWNGKSVVVRYNPEDMDSVRIYSAETGQFICEAEHEDNIDLTRLRDANRTMRKSLLERTVGYYREARDEDVARQAAYDAENDPESAASAASSDRKSTVLVTSRRGFRAKPTATATLVDAGVEELERLFSPKAQYKP